MHTPESAHRLSRRDRQARDCQSLNHQAPDGVVRLGGSPCLPGNTRRGCGLHRVAGR